MPDDRPKSHNVISLEDVFSISDDIDVRAYTTTAAQANFFSDPTKALADSKRASSMPVDTFQYTESEMGQIVDVLEHPVRPPDVPAAVVTMLSSLALFGTGLYDFYKSSIETPQSMAWIKLAFSIFGMALCVTVIWRTVSQRKSYRNDPHGRRAIDTAKQMESYLKSRRGSS